MKWEGMEVETSRQEIEEERGEFLSLAVGVRRTALKRFERRRMRAGKGGFLNFEE